MPSSVYSSLSSAPPTGGTKCARLTPLSRAATQVQRHFRERKLRKQCKAFSPKFNGVVHDLDEDKETRQVSEVRSRKARIVVRCETRRQERRALKASALEQSAGKGKKGTCRSKARSCKLGFSADFAADPSYVY